MPDLNPGLEAAARWVEKRREDYDAEHELRASLRSQATHIPGAARAQAEKGGA